MSQILKTLAGGFFILSGLFVGACTPQDNIDGKYLGKDTSKSPGIPIEINLGRAGDGYLNGILTIAEGPVKTALIVGNLSYFTNKIKFVVNEGPCAGTYSGTFSKKDNMISGRIDEAAEKCPDFMRFFEVQRQ